MGEIIALSIVLLVGAGLLFIVFKNGYSLDDNNNILLLLGGVFCAIGILGILNIFGCGSKRLITLILLWLIAGGMGGMTTYSACWTIYTKIFCCRVKTQAAFNGIASVTTYKHGKRYLPQFSYTLENRRYQKISCFDSYQNKKRLEKKYISGQEYPIFVSVKNPKDFVLKRRVWLSEWVMLCYGLLCDAVVIWGTYLQLAPFFTGI